MIDIDIGLARGDFSLEVAFRSEAAITALFGRSGAGKSSLIAAVAGLVRPDRGHIVIDGVTLFDKARRISVPAYRRRIGLVFQDAQLFPHLNVRQNLTYGQWFVPASASRLPLETVIDVLGIGDLLARRPAGLSGGERQRVAIGRALLAAPRILLMDEPLASLDAPRRLEILPLIERLRDEFGLRILYVSHQVEEVARLADQVVVIDKGRVTLSGPPEMVLAPMTASLSEARLGTVSVLAARIRFHDERYGLTLLDHPAGEISVLGRAGLPGSAARVLVHGMDVSLALERPHGTSLRTVLEGVVSRSVIDDGPVARIDVALRGGETLAAFVTRKSVDDLGLGEGDAVFAMVKAVSIEEGAGRG